MVRFLVGFLVGFLAFPVALYCYTGLLCRESPRFEVDADV